MSSTTATNAASTQCHLESMHKSSEATWVQTPWWAWLGPVALFIIVYSAVWPHPFHCMGGDEVYFYRGAHYIAASGEYKEDHTQLPAQYITRCPPLYSAMWAMFLRIGIEPVLSLKLLNGLCIAVLSALGGTLAYQLTRSWGGVVVWSVLSCIWPMGTEWWIWITPHTDVLNATLFVAEIYCLTRCLADQHKQPLMWLTIASLLAGLNMFSKALGIFGFPAVGLVALYMTYQIGLRRGWWIAPTQLIILACPYAAWMLRNYLLIGSIESEKIWQDQFWRQLDHFGPNVVSYYLPPQVGAIVLEHVGTLTLLMPLLIIPVVCAALAWKRRAYAALMGAAVAFSGFAGLLIMNTFLNTAHSRYWTMIFPSLFLAVLAFRLPKSPRWAALSKFILSTGVMYCCFRLVTNRRYLWFDSDYSFWIHQTIIVTGVVCGSIFLFRYCRELFKNDLSVLAHVVAALGCVAIVVLFTRVSNAARPVVTYAPLSVIGVAYFLRYYQVTLSRVLQPGLIVVALAATWWQGGWNRHEVEFSPIHTFVRDGLPLRVRKEIVDARAALAVRDWTGEFTSNSRAIFNDLFNKRPGIELPKFKDPNRFAAGEPQLEADSQQVIHAWTQQVHAQLGVEPLLGIYIPLRREQLSKYKVRPCFSLSELEQYPQIDLEWVHRGSDYELAIVRVTAFEAVSLKP